MPNARFICSSRAFLALLAFCALFSPGSAQAQPPAGKVKAPETGLWTGTIGGQRVMACFEQKEPSATANHSSYFYLRHAQRIALSAMRQVPAARSGMTAIAQQAGLSRESLYRAFRKPGNPTVMTLSSVLAAAGQRLSVLPA